jgi:hypothetical protein
VRIVAMVLVVSLTSCNFAIKHPAVTAGLVSGGLAMGTCELSASNPAACSIVSGTVGVGLALITAFALWLGYEDDTGTGAGTGSNDVNVVDPTNLQPVPVFRPRRPKPAPVQVDAGVSPVSIDAGVALDAGAAPVDGP